MAMRLALPRIRIDLAGSQSRDKLRMFDCCDSLIKHLTQSRPVTAQQRGRV
jgi:hypothetical protein